MRWYRKSACGFDFSGWYQLEYIRNSRKSILEVSKRDELLDGKRDPSSLVNEFCSFIGVIPLISDQALKSPQWFKAMVLIMSSQISMGEGFVTMKETREEEKSRKQNDCDLIFMMKGLSIYILIVRFLLMFCLAYQCSFFTVKKGSHYPFAVAAYFFLLICSAISQGSRNK